MLTFKSILSLPVFLSTSLLAHAFASPGLVRRNGDNDNDNDNHNNNGNGNGKGNDDRQSDFARTFASGFLDQQHVLDKPDYAAKFLGGERCSEEEMIWISAGFDEMNQLFQAALNVDWSGDAERDFFGDPLRIANYTGLIEENLLRAAQYSNLQRSNGAQMPDIHVRCDDPEDYCGENMFKDSGKHAVYNIGNEPHINFCPQYFRMDPLDARVDEKADQEKDNIMKYYNRATAWARQVMHFSAVGIAIREMVNPMGNVSAQSMTWTTTMTNASMNISFLAGVPDEHPKTDLPNDIFVPKYAYGASRAKLLAALHTQLPYDTANNAETYALYAQARYVMARKGFYPNEPKLDSTDQASLLRSKLQEGDKYKYNWVCYVNLDTIKRGPGTNMFAAQVSSSASALFRRRLLRTGPLEIGASGALSMLIVLVMFF